MRDSFEVMWDVLAEAEVCKLEPITDPTMKDILWLKVTVNDVHLIH